MNKFIFIFFTLFLLSCSINTPINGYGIIMDNYNNPISNAEVTILCWEDLGFLRDEVTYSKKILYTDNNGKFDFDFAKGFKLNIGVRAEKYDIKVVSINNNQDFNNLNIVLDNTITNNTIYYSDRYLVMEKKSKKEENSFIEGLNIIEGKSTEKSNAHLWIEGGNTIVCKSGNGIIPINQKNNTNLITDFLKAPLNGYLEQYKITGKEAGYFVKTDQNTYAKIIISGIYENNSGIDDYFEKGYVINIIYQPDSTCILSIPHLINMERLLISLP